MPPSPVVTLVASDPEHRPTEIVVVHDVVSAVVRTVVRAIRRGLVVVVEHPRRGRDIEQKTPNWITVMPPSSIWRNHSQKIFNQIF